MVLAQKAGSVVEWHHAQQQVFPSQSIETRVWHHRKEHMLFINRRHHRPARRAIQNGGIAMLAKARDNLTRRAGGQQRLQSAFDTSERSTVNVDVLLLVPSAL